MNPRRWQQIESLYQSARKLERGERDALLAEACRGDEERELEELNGKKYVSQVFVAAIYAGLGENAQALACLERACEDRCAWLLRCLVSDIRFDALRDEGLFRSLLRRTGINPQLP